MGHRLLWVANSSIYSVKANGGNNLELAMGASSCLDAVSSCTDYFIVHGFLSTSNRLF